MTERDETGEEKIGEKRKRKREEREQMRDILHEER